ncbi:MAG: group 1 truncated hemoglobin [Propionibacteriales bacterium]|jgi:hemoglobin|nr:group 1 truncated hemoglobin [Propionibacteriales bacterium]
MTDPTLYERLGGYDAIAAVSTALLGRLHADPTIGRFWQNRGSDGLAREKQLLIDFLSHAAGGPLLYTGRGLLQSHTGMGITDQDWDLFVGYLNDTLDDFAVPAAERNDLLAYIDSTRVELVGV